MDNLDKPLTATQVLAMWREYSREYSRSTEEKSAYILQPLIHNLYEILKKNGLIKA